MNRIIYDDNFFSMQVFKQLNRSGYGERNIPLKWPNVFFFFVLENTCKNDNLRNRFCKLAEANKVRIFQ